MRAVAQRLVWMVGLLCLCFGVAGVIAMSPVTMALSVTGWFLTRSVIKYLAQQGDIAVTTPDVQYWARSLWFRTLGLMATGLVLAAVVVSTGFSFHLAWHEQALLTSLLIAVMVVVIRIAAPSFFAASWEIHGARERRKRIRSSMIVSRILVRAVAALILVVSMVGSFSFFQSLRAGPRFDRVVAMAQDVSHAAPTTVSEMTEIFSPTESSTR